MLSIGPNGIKKKNRPLLSSYNVISEEKRFQLIQFVIIQKMKVKDASQYLKINYQTAKSILRRYHLTGEISRQYRITT